MSALTQRLRRPDRVEAAVLAIVVAALALRLYDLGARAMHHDESLHAYYSWLLAEGRGYVHNPLMHGPLQFHAIAAIFKLFDAADATARIPAVLAGTALVATPLLLRRWLGGGGVIVAAVLITLSPPLLYFSRFARNDLPVALFMLLMVAAIWRYRDDGRYRWLVLLAVALTLSFASKETAYLSAAILLLYLNVVLTARLVAQRGARGARAWREGVLLAPVAWIVAAAWGPLARRLRLGDRPREADLLIVLGTLTLPFLAAAIRFPLALLRVTVGEDDRALAVVASLELIIAAAIVGLAWNWRRWLPLALLAYAMTLPLFSAGFANLDGVGGAFWGQLDYWLDQQDVARGTQPALYYFMMLPLYEFATLLPAIAGGAWLLLRGDRLTRLLAWWFLATLVALSLAGEKMPWLTVHLALPLTVLAAHALAQTVPRIRASMRSGAARRGGWVAAGIGAVALVPLFAFSVWGAANVTYRYSDTPVEPLIYTQTSPDVPQLLRQIDAYVEQRGGRDAVAVLVDTTQSLAWPWAWYLRDYGRAGFVSAEAVLNGEVAADAVLIVADETLRRQPQLRDGYAQQLPYRHRWWFPEAGYKTMTPGGVLSGIWEGSLIVDLFDFYLNRVDEDTLGTLQAEVLLPAAQ